MNKELYFCLELSGSEHDIVESQLREFCKDKNVKMIYYRRLKDWDVSCFREIKFMGEVGLIKGFIKENKLEDFIRKNPCREE